MASFNDTNNELNQGVQYNISPVPFHLHDGTDSPLIPMTAGTGIMFAPSGKAIGKGSIITNIGVTSLTAGTAIALSGGTGTVTVSNVGVTSLLAGTGISLSPSNGTGAVTVTNTSTGTAVGFPTRVALTDTNTNPPTTGTVITFATTSLDNNSEYNSANGVITIKGTGTYFATANFRLISGSTNTQVNGEIRQNGSAIDKLDQATAANDSQTRGAAASILFSANANDTVAYWMAKPNGNGLIQSTWFNLFRVA